MLRKCDDYDIMAHIMEQTVTAFKISPIDMEQRQKLDIRPGDTARVHLKIQEKGKTRIQIFEGLVLAVKHGKEDGGSFTVRKTASGVGVEKIFPIYSPSIDKIEIVKRSKVRQSKLYYIREKVAREIRRKMRNMKMVSMTTQKDDDGIIDSDSDAVEDKIVEAEKSEDVVVEEVKEEGGIAEVTEEKEDKKD